MPIKQLRNLATRRQTQMGLAASNMRFLSLTARKSDLEFRGQQTNQQRMLIAANTEQISEDMAALLRTGTIDPDTNPEYLALVADLEALHADDRILEMELDNIDTQHNTVQTEIDAVKKVIDKNIDMTFKTFA